MTDPITIERKKPQQTDLKGQDKALNREEKLETALEDSMDASDPPSTAAPGDHGDPVPSSGFREEDDAKDKPGKP